MIEVTAWHEAGHATMAVLAGGVIERVTIEPPDDDGLNRYGDTVTRWSGQSQTQYLMSEIRVSLAGPIAEMIHTGFHEAIDSVPEWQADWLRAKEAAKPFGQKADQILKQTETEIFELFEQPNMWACIGAITDDLLAFETLEHAQVKATIDFWTTR